jgi:C-terminal processing protease CtpA/Prc
VHGRDGQQTVWESDPPSIASCVPADVEVAVLTSSRTFSSAEALAYHLAVRGRVTVVGESTRGAADHVVSVRLPPQVLGLLPEAEVRDSHTGANWEGDGVIPDIAAPADAALEAALARV